MVSFLLPGVARAAYYGDETDYAVVSLSTPAAYGQWYICASTYGAEACFMPDGELFFVKDTFADGRSAAADWWYYGNRYRSRARVNQHGYGTWAICNKSFVEHGDMVVRAMVYEGGNPIYDTDTWQINTET